MRRATLVLCVLALVACRGGGEKQSERGHAERSREVPGVETAPAATEPVQELVRAFATVVADEQLAEVRDAQTQLAQAEARRRLAAQQVRRLEELAKGAVAPLKELEAARADAAAASAEAARASKVLAGFGADQDHAPLADGEQWVIARVAQVDVPHIAAGAAAAFSADAFPERELPARVDAGPAYVDPATRTAPVRLRVRDPAQQLRPGMTGAVTLEMGAPHDAVVVPVAAVVYDDAQPVVFVEEAGGRYALRAVKLGIVRRDRVEIASGVEAGARVVVTGAASLLSATRLPPEEEE